MTSVSMSILSVSSDFLLFRLLALLPLRMVPMVIFDRVLSPDFRGRQNAPSSVVPTLSSEDDDQRDSFCGGDRGVLGVPIAITFKLFMTLSSALSTPASIPPDLNFRGEADMGVVWMMDDRLRRPGVVKESCGESLPAEGRSGESFGGESLSEEGLVADIFSGEGWNGPRMI